MIYSLPYIILALLFLIIWFFFEKRGKNVSAFCSIIFIFFYGFRGFVAWDWMSYYTRFNLPVEFITDVYSSELGFAWTCIIIKSIFDNYHFFIFVLTIIDLWLLFKIFKRYAKRNIALMFFFFVVFYTPSEIDLLRNFKAILLFYFSLQYYIDRKYLKYILINLIGLSFHSSSIIYLVISFIIFRQLNRKLILLLFIIGNVLFLKQEGIFTLIFEKISSIYDIGIYQVLFDGYLNSDKFSSQYGVSFGYIERLISFVFVYKFYNLIISKDKKREPVINLFYSFIFINLYFSDLTIVVERMGNLFRFSYIILCPVIYDSINLKFLKKTYLGFIIIFSITRFHVFTNNIFYEYENILFGAKSYFERKALIEKYIDDVDQ